MIRNLKTDEEGRFANGTFDSHSLFEGEMNVSVFVDDGATESYAEMCIEHYNNLKNNEALMEKLDEYLQKYFVWMYYQWEEFSNMERYRELYESLKPLMEDCEAGKSLLNHLSEPMLLVYAPEDERIGYGIEWACPWEPEHGCLMIFREDDLLYAGGFTSVDAWCDEDEYFCIWHDESMWEDAEE